MGANDSTPANASEPNGSMPPQRQGEQLAPPTGAEAWAWSLLQGWDNTKSPTHPEDPIGQVEVWKNLRATRECPGGVSFDVLDPESCKHLGQTIVEMNKAFMQQGLPNLLDSPAGIPLETLPHWPHLSSAITGAVQNLVQSVSHAPVGTLTVARAVGRRSTPKQVEKDWITSVKTVIGDWVMNRPTYTDTMMTNPFRPRSLEAVQNEPGYITTTENHDYVLTLDLSGWMRGGDYLLGEKGVHPSVEERLYHSKRLPPLNPLLNMHNDPEGPIALVPAEVIPFIPAAPWFGQPLHDPAPVQIEYQALTEAVNRQVYWAIQQRPGRGILHAGAQRHKNMPPAAGSRLSIVLYLDRFVNLSRLAALPGTVFERIFSFLAPSDLASVRRVSKDLRAHTFAPIIWKAQVQHEIAKYGGDYRSVYVNGAQVPLEWAEEKKAENRPEGGQEGAFKAATPSPIEVAFAERAVARKNAGLYASQSSSASSSAVPIPPLASPVASVRPLQLAV